MACGQKEPIATVLKTPPERLRCELAGERPALAGVAPIDWSKVATVDQARAEHARYVTATRDRNGKVTAYILRLEEKLFVCADNAEWRRQFEAALPDGPTAPNVD